MEKRHTYTHTHILVDFLCFSHFGGMYAHRRMKLKKQLLGEIETLVIHVVHNGFGRPKHRNFQKCLRGSSLSQFTFFSCPGQLPGLQKKSCISTSLAGLTDEFPNCMATWDELIF